MLFLYSLPYYLLNNLKDASQDSQGGPRNMATSFAACLRSVSSETPLVHDAVPLLDVDGDVKAARLQGTGSGSLYCPRAVPTQCVVSCTNEQMI